MRAAPTLLEVQQAFVAAVQGRDGRVAQWIVAGGLKPEARVQVYANAIASTQIATLRATYPAVAALVGEDFFEAAVLRYRLAHPSACGNLQAFGGDFPVFLERMPETAALAYLGDVARLEWLRQESALAASATPMAMAALQSALQATIMPRLRLHPSLRLLASPFPVLTIWRYATEPTGERLQLPLEGEEVALWRDGGDVAMAQLDATGYVFLMAMSEGRRLDVAYLRALTTDAGFNMVDCLQSLIEQGLIVGVDLLQGET